MIHSTKNAMTRENRRRFLVLLLLPILLLLWYAIYRNPSAPAGKSPATVSDREHRLRSERHIVYPAQPLEPGYVPFSRMETGVPDSETEYVLAGKITTDQDIPLAGATVSLMPGEARFSQLGPDPLAKSANEQAPGLSASSDDQGDYRISSAQPIRNLVVIRKEGYVTIENIQNVTVPGTVVRNYWMWRAPACVEGRVLDDAGNPIGGASVSAGLLMQNGYVWENSMLQPVEATTDSSGRYAIYNLPDSELNVPRISYPPLQQQQAQGNGRVTVRNRGFVGETRGLRFVAGPCARADFRLRAARVVAFRVKDRRGEVIPQARIETSLAGNFWTDDHGLATLNLPVDAPTLGCAIFASGFKAKTVTIDTKVPPSEVVLDDADRLTGRVLDQSGVPLFGARVFAGGTSLPSDVGLRNNGSAETDPDGRFSLALSFPPATSITASKDGYNQERVDLSGNSSSYVEIRLARADTGIFGTAVDENGRPARRFMITALAYEEGYVVTQTFESDDGRFIMMGLKDYTLYLKAETMTAPYQQAHIDQLELRKGTYYGPLLFRLRKEPERPAR